MTVRIFDRMSSGESVESTAGITTPGTTSFWRKAAHTATRVTADEAAQLFFQSDLNKWNLGDGAGKFGRQIPPYELTWIEWKEPSAQIVGGGALPLDNKRYAVLLRSETLDNGDRIIGATALFTIDRGSIRLFPYCIGLHVDKLGTVKDAAPSGWPEEVDAVFGDMDQEVVAPYMLRQIMPAFLGIGLMHCRTVTTSTRSAPIGVRRKQAKSKKAVALDYRRIEIGGATGEHLQRNRSAGRGLVAQHMVRAHIRKVVKPQFGRDGGFTGDQLIPGHLSGNPTRGRVNKEYTITGEGAL